MSWRILATLCAAGIAASPCLLAQDCNNNGIPDELDVQPTIDFDAALNYPAAILCTSFAVGNLNGDAYPDVVAISPNDTFSVLINRGDGTFPFPVRYAMPAASRPIAVAVADFNNDGRDDVAIVTRDDNSVRYYRNTGAGVLAHQGTAQYLFGSTLRGIVAARFDADANVDVAILFDAGARVELGQGNVSFSPVGGFLSAGTTPSAILAADLNNDGDNELLIANGGSNNLSILSGNGNGTFAAAVNYPAGTNPRGVAAGDLTGDGYADVVVSSVNTDSVVLFQNDGVAAGTLTGMGTRTVGDAPNGPAIRDFDGDGLRDITVVNRDGTVSVLFNEGALAFTRVDHPTVRFGSSLAAEDVDDDGDLDILTGSLGSTLTVLLNSGEGAFPPATPRVAVDGLFGIVAGDFVGGPAIDLAATNLNTNRVQIFENTGGALVPATDFPVGDYPIAIVAGDWNNDGDLDIATSAADDGNVTIGHNNGDGTFSTSTIALGPSIMFIAAIDYDVDGDLDLAASYTGTGTNDTTCPLPGTIFLLNNTGGVFTLATSFSTINCGMALAVGYFDADARPDLAVSAVNGDQIRVYRNVAGMFVESANLTHVRDHFSLAAGDVNGDGLDDLVSTRYSIADFIEDGVKVFVNLGDATFSPGTSYYASAPLNVTLADLDNDGDVDIAAAGVPTDDVATLANRGDGTFRNASSWLASIAPTGVAAFPLDGDDLLDLAVAGLNPGSYIALLPNRSHAPASDDANGNGVPDECEQVGDVDGDGDVDIQDLALLLSQFGGCSGTPGFDPAADLDGSGCVGLQDLALLLGYFGA